MLSFIIYNKDEKILRIGQCSNKTIRLQVEEGEFVMEGVADDVTQKVEFDGFDVKGQPINPRIVEKTPEEIKADKPIKSEPLPYEQHQANVTNEQWQDILDRLTELER